MHYTVLFLFSDDNAFEFQQLVEAHSVFTKELLVMALKDLVTL